MTSLRAIAEPLAATNVARRLTQHARRRGDQLAVVEPASGSFGGRAANGNRNWRCLNYAQLDERSERLAAGLLALGVTPGTRLALLVRPGIDFVSLVFGLLKSGAVAILIDPGMGRANLVRCLAEAEPEGFIAISPAQAVRALLWRRFPKSRFHVTVGTRWFWGGVTLAGLERLGDEHLRGGCLAALRPENIASAADDPAAILFTTGSTGAPKGVLYTHGNFDHQVTEIRDQYAIEPGGTDLAGFPLFGLFNAAMGVTTVFPAMDFTRPASVDPRNILEAVRRWDVTQSFGSPALWNLVGRYCVQQGERMASLRQVFSAGAPVPGHVLSSMKGVIHPDGEIHTPYGATEALPVATISASVVLGETQQRTDEGAGVCVGQKFPGIEWRVIRIVDGPLPNIADTEPLPTGEIGELIVRGPVVTSRYVTRLESNALAKIADAPGFWHRMGDVGWLDPRSRFWFCGRMAHRVRASCGTLFTVPCEAIYNKHPRVFRSALVGIGPVGSQRPVVIVEPSGGNMPRNSADSQTLLDQLRQLGSRHDTTREIHDFLLHPSLPVDIRHNAKIFREKLVPWAAARLATR